MKKTSLLLLAFSLILGAASCTHHKASVLTINVPANIPTGTLLANKRVLWLGDSITQDGKYVTFVEYFLDKEFPAQNYDIISIGLSSETISGLTEETHSYKRPCVLNRLDRALAETKPAIVVACYGMNDGIYLPQSVERLKAFQAGLNTLIAKVKASGAELVLITPPPFDALPIHDKAVPEAAAAKGYSAPFEGYDSVLVDYANWECALPKADAVQVIDLHTAMVGQISKHRETSPDFSFTKDGIHPGEEGHFFMAGVILEKLGASIPTGTTLESVKADPLFDLVKKHRESRSKGWLSYIGYTSQKTVRSDSLGDTEKNASALQAQIDTSRRSQ